jgi:bla regulator protein blaR1
MDLVMSAASTARSASLTLTVAATAAVTIATVAQTFEVASIKLNKARRGPLTSLEATVYDLPMAVMPGGRFRLTAVPTRTLIQLAYGVSNFQITGEPPWVNDELYDVDAKAEGTTSSDQIRLMLQALLADRFRLAVRRETRTGRVYELAPARGGLKITPTPPGGCYDPRSPSGPPPVFLGPLVQCDGWRRRILTPPPDRQDRIEAVAVRMATLVDLVIADVSRPVIDKTGFEQPFNFVLEFTPNVAVSDYRGPATLPDAGPSAAPVPISTALQEQLGIQLRSTEAPVETIVIDRIERPSEN